MVMVSVFSFFGEVSESHIIIIQASQEDGNGKEKRLDTQGQFYIRKACEEATKEEKNDNE